MILVTGAAGKTGLAVLRNLARKGKPARALVHRQGQTAVVRETGAAEIVVGDILDGDTLADAIQGVDTIYLICPNVHPHEFKMGKAMIAAANKQAEPPRIVYHSVMEPRVEAMPHHWQKSQVEEALIGNGLPFTILQPASYMQNILPYWVMIKERGEYAVPYSIDAKFSPVDLVDIAEAAAEALTNPEHLGATYLLCGPDVLSSAQIAEAAGRSLGHDVKARRQSLDDWKRLANERGMPAYAMDALMKMFRYYDLNGFAATDATLQKLLGRPPKNFAQFISQLT